MTGGMRKLGRGALGALKEYGGLLGALAALVVVFSLVTERFLKTGTFLSVANLNAEYYVAAVGMTFVLIVGEIDLSVGSVLALSGSVLGVCLTRYGMSVPAAVAAALGVGVGCGLVNGLVTITWRLPSFIVTLGMMEAARGAAYLVTSSRTEPLGAEIGAIAETGVGGLSVPFLVAVGLVALGQLLLSRTVFGRHAVAIGTNQEAVRLSGIDPRRVKLAVFVLSGALAAAAGVFQASRMRSAVPNTGVAFELEVIAAAVIGGTSLMGGRGSVVRSFLGALILAVMGSGLVQKAAAAPSKKLITGCVIVAAVILDYYRQRFSRARRWSPDGAGSTTREDAREELPRATAPSDNKDSGG